MPASLGNVVISAYHYRVVISPEIPRAEQSPRLRPGLLSGTRRRWATASAVLIALAAVSVTVPRVAVGGPEIPDAPGGLQVNLVTSPMAVPAAGVNFSWVTRDARPGEQQGAYEI